MATVAKADILTRVKTLSKIPTSPVILTDAEINSAIDDALRNMNEVAPATTTKDVTGAATSYYLLATDLTPNWDDDTSRLTLVEYPAATVADDDCPIYQDPDNDYEIYRTSAGLYLRFFAARPSTAETIRVTFTHARAFDGTNLTMPTSDEGALEQEAAAIVCQSIATYFGRASDVGGIGAASVDWQTKADAFRRMSDNFHKSFMAHFTGEVDGNDAGIMLVDRDATWPRALGGRGYLFHPERSR